MIQRIQTLYMFLAALLMSLLFVSPMVTVVSGTEELKLMAYGFVNAQEGDGIYITATVIMAIVIGMSALLPLVNIFLFKKRTTQFRFCVVELVFIVGALVLMIYNVFVANSSLEGGMDARLMVNAPMFFPLVAILLIFLAIRGILKDIALLKSLNRIR